METLVTFVLDETGSMASIADDTIGGFNTYIEELKKQGNILFTLIQFDSNRTNVIHRAVPIADVPPLTPDTYRPRASTPLIDAAYKAIKATEAKAVAGQKVQVVIQTDGQENCSTQHTFAELAALIKDLTGKGWLFTFLGAGIDAFAQASQMGIAAGQTMSYGRGMSAQAFSSASRSSRMYASTGSVAAAGFTDHERRAASDGSQPILPPDPAPLAPPPSRPPPSTDSLVDDITI